MNGSSEFYCTHRDCGLHGRLIERQWPEHGGYPCCMLCDRVLRENVRAPGVVWTGALDHRYRDKGSEGYYAPAGQWAWERNTPDGKPRPVRLETWQDVHAYSKREGCYDPRDLPKTIEVGEDGKSSSLGRGYSGQEI